LGVDDPVWDHSTRSENRTDFLKVEVPERVATLTSGGSPWARTRPYDVTAFVVKFELLDLQCPRPGLRLALSIHSDQRAACGRHAGCAIRPSELLGG
jgi:hypothetical protein